MKTRYKEILENDRLASAKKITEMEKFISKSAEIITK
jgi:hypothetical protein